MAYPNDMITPSQVVDLANKNANRLVGPVAECGSPYYERMIRGFNSLAPKGRSPNPTRGDRRTALTESNQTYRPVGALKIKDAAEYLGGISHITVRRLIKRGLIKPNRALRHILIPVAELDRLLTAGQR